ncbi:MAG TPA: TIGR04282 family arsenosugar biosynthesis glycosyltransferase [Chloroflexota bacterium]|nr:TIGR04282 family arsenosugar biosynthesis glycosyltransferase [Chloroflexota bacterium]
MERAQRRLLVIVCRNPDVGSVKTRLIPALGAAGARSLYRAFLQDLRDRFETEAYDLRWAHTPEGGPLPATFTCGHSLAQEGPDLGHRLLNIFHWAAEAGYDATTVISSDVPQLSRAVVDAAFAALGACDVVLAPSEDGGYHLVGMCRPHDIFTMVPMSTPHVLAQTRAAVAGHCLSLHLLAEDFDVDLPEDLSRLGRLLDADLLPRQSHTARALRRLSLRD